MNEFKYEYKQLNTKCIVSEPSYQRVVDFTRVKRIVANFNPNLVNPLKVSYRNNKYYVFDGQHTLRALIMHNGNKDLMVNCKVYYDLTLEDEAKLFAEQNGIQRAVTSAQKFNSLFVSKDVDIVDFKETIESTGIECDFTKHTATDNRVICYTALYKIYTKHGKQHLTTVLRTILNIWGGEEISLRKEIVNGMSIFISTYKGNYVEKTLITKLSKVSPLTIFRDGKVLASGGDKRFAKQILQIYNKGASTNKLEDKF